MNNHRLLGLIQWSVFCTLFGRGMLHFTADQPYSLIFSHPSSFFFQNSIPQLNSVEIFIGVMLLISAFVAILPLKWLRDYKLTYLFPVPVLCMIVHCYATFLKADLVPEQFIEHALQLLLPLLLMVAVIKKADFTIPKWRFTVYILVALTFIGHGIYAVGFHYVPDNFTEMVTHSLHTNSSQTNRFLFAIGILDFISSLFLFSRILKKESLIYMVIWGFLTSIARLYAYIGIEDSAILMQQNTFQVILRLPHAFVPLSLLIWEVQGNLVRMRLSRPKIMKIH